MMQGQSTCCFGCISSTSKARAIQPRHVVVSSTPGNMSSGRGADGHPLPVLQVQNTYSGWIQRPLRYSIEPCLRDENVEGLQSIFEFDMRDGNPAFITITGITASCLLVGCHSAIASDQSGIVLAALQPLDVLWFCLHHPVTHQAICLSMSHQK
jgi:hypothetical protein